MLIAGVLLYYGFNYLKGTNVFSRTNRFYVKYDHIKGLAPGSAVKIKGVQVGRVNSLTFDQKNQTIIVALDIQNDIQLGNSSVAELASAGFLGGELIILKEEINSELLRPGDTLIPEFNKGLSEILDKAEPFADNLTLTITRVNEILLGMEGFSDTITSAISNMSKLAVTLTKTLDNNDEKVDSIFSAVNKLTSQLNKSIEPLGPILENMAAFTDSLKKSEFKAVISSTNDLLQNLNFAIDSLKSGQGTLGRLMVDDSLYNNLNQTLLDLDRLLIHFNNYPRDFMKPLGRKNKKLEGVK